MTAEDDGLEGEEVVLTSRAVNPFNDWSDWYGSDGEAVVTFFTMKEHLWSCWSGDCVSFEYDEDNLSLEERMDRDGERVVEHEKFDVTSIRSPGIYLDGTYYEDEDAVDESYTIIVPYPFLSPKLCRAWIEKLNEKYDREFRLEVTGDQEARSAGLESMGVNLIRVLDGNG